MKSLKVCAPILAALSLGGGSSYTLVSSNNSSFSWTSLLDLKNSFSSGGTNQYNFNSQTNKDLKLENTNLGSLEAKEVSSLSATSSTTSTSLEVTNQIEEQKTNLEVEVFSLDTEQQESPVSAIQGIFKESSRETNIQKIEEERQKVPSETLKNLSSSSQGMKEAFKTLKGTDSESSAAASTYFLKPEGRNAIQDYLEKYSEIQTRQQELRKKLETESAGINKTPSRRRRSLSDNEVSSTTSPTNIPVVNIQKFNEALQKINWKQRGLDWDPLYKAHKEKKWNDSNNPFSPFLENEQEWNNWLSEVKSAIEEKEKYLRGKTWCVGLIVFGSNNWCYTELSSYEGKIKKALAGMEVIVGKSLLRQMNQLSSSLKS
ncbi:hypothetical protein MSUIS_05380 [Mycoplasma suis KI3806]|uniref:Uncharacterized protein n=1 Tax=Mycoplasma suis (strain KI_3806) TaxID=708248 RepID=F0V1V0_MYCS3|nr:hypothetical protein [Mycoplasma suis]CBZ40631.1 hypothetical protein MSUIS_05380 [Mycoplasma suis KI3806]